MDALNKVISTVSGVFEFNQATFSGSIDVIIVKQKDGTYKGTGFHARFGKVHVIKSKDRVVKIEINGMPTNVIMKLGDSGEAYFEDEAGESGESQLLEDLGQNENVTSLENILYISGKSSPKTNNESENIKPIYLNGNEKSPGNQTAIKEKGFFDSILGAFKKDKATENQIKVERLVTCPLTDKLGNKICVTPKMSTEKDYEINIESKASSSSSSQINIDALVKENDMDRKDIETAQQILSQISNKITIKIATYDGPINLSAPDQIDSILERYMLPWVEFVQKPRDYVNNRALIICVNGVLYGYKVASYILATFYNDLKRAPGKSYSKQSSFDKTVDAQNSSDRENSTVSTSKQLYSPKSYTSTKTAKTANKIRKSLRLSSDRIKLLNLKPGLNTITYIINTGLQGTQKLTANIYLWSHKTKLIVTDVDGTITKSDVLGAILPLIGKDWTQPGIAPLFANISRNGYQIIYLSSRAIGQIGFTRQFVKTVNQDGKTLPEGPIISSPEQLLPCFKREIVFSKPEFYKAAALRDIRSLFPSDHNPFHAGFGNRENDAVAYRYIGIPLENIFTVNCNGEVHHAAHTLYNSYSYLNAKVKELFPCIENAMAHHS